MADDLVTGTVHFMDGTHLKLQWPRQAGTDAAVVAANIKKALEADRILAEVDGNLMVIPVRNVKYVQITPSPQRLPVGVLRGAQRIL